jgi:hypothetical protein
MLTPKGESKVDTTNFYRKENAELKSELARLILENSELRKQLEKDNATLQATSVEYGKLIRTHEQAKQVCEALLPLYQQMKREEAIDGELIEAISLEAPSEPAEVEG